MFTYTDTSNLVDYLTCGQCAQEFPLKNITNFIQHKTVNCEKNTDDISENQQSPDISSTLSVNDDVYSMLSCSSCLQGFVTARGLLHHVQFTHNLNIFIPQEKGNKQSLENIILRDDLHGEEQSNPTANKNQEPICCEKRKAFCSCRKIGHCFSEDGGTKTGVRAKSPTCIKRYTAAGEGTTTICCSSQECCVTIIPGTHEEPRRCCNSIVPKKRKLHMVKHMDKENNDLRQKSNEVSCDKPSLIYIDVGSREHQYDDSLPKEMTSIDTVDITTSESQVEYSEAINSNDSSQSDDENSNSGRESVIIETGSGLNVPITVTSGKALETNSINNNTHHIHVYQPINMFENNTYGETNDDSYNPVVLSSIPTDLNTNRQSNEISNSSFTPVAINAVHSLVAIGGIDYQDDEDEGERESGRKRRYPTSRPYKCESCSEAFNQRIHLKKHMSKHTGVKPFKCQQCNYSTVERSHLKVHIRIHTGEKPFKCTHCEYATAQNSTLKIHLKRRHGGKMFQCDSCSKMFTQPAMLENHQVQHQKDQNMSLLPLLSTDFTTDNITLCDPSVNISIPHDIPISASNNILPPVIGEDIPLIPFTANPVVSLNQDNQALTNQISLTTLNLY